MDFNWHLAGVTQKHARAIYSHNAGATWKIYTVLYLLKQIMSKHSDAVSRSTVQIHLNLGSTIPLNRHWLLYN